MNEQAIKEFDETLRSAKDHPLAKAALGYAYGATGQREQANKILVEFKLVTVTSACMMTAPV